MSHFEIVAAALAATLWLAVAGQAQGMELASADFAPEGAIPSQFTCDGQDISPQLSWNWMPLRR